MFKKINNRMSTETVELKKSKSENIVNRDLNREFKKLFKKGSESLANWKPLSGKMKGSIDVIDFFSGCGGMSLGFASLSEKNNIYNIIGGVDINEIALKSFHKNYNAKTLNKDIKEMYLNNEHDAIRDYFGITREKKRPLVVIGCAPCQGFSAHGKKNWDKKEDDERNTLIGAFTDIIVTFEPDFIVMENVPEILGKKYQQHYNEAKEVLEAKGYSIKQDVYNSATFGVPQARFRAILIASRNPFSLPPKLLSQEEFVTVKDAIGDLPIIESGEYSETDIYHRSSTHKQSTIDTISQVPKDGGSRPKGVGPKCLDKVNGFSDVYGRLSWNKPSITITKSSRNPASGRFSHPVQNRGLTIREAARIQSFPDGFLFEGNLEQCFQQIGEAVPPLLSLAVATQIAIEFYKRKVL